MNQFLFDHLLSGEPLSADVLARAAAESPAKNTFGLHENLEQETILFSWLLLQDSLEGLNAPTEKVIENLTAMVGRDVKTALSTRRWNVGRLEPTSYMPGDVVAVRGFAGASCLHRANEAQSLGGEIAEAWVARTVPLITALYDAVPHFLHAEAAEALLDADPADDEVIADLRLPWPVSLIMFDRPLRLPERYEFQSEALNAAGEAYWAARDEQVESLRQSIIREARAAGHDPDAALRKKGFMPEGQPDDARLSEDAYHSESGALEGVVLFRNAAGGLDERVLWLTSADPDVPEGTLLANDRIRSLMPGLLTWSTAAPAIRNLACAVAFAEWTEPNLRAGLPDAYSDEWYQALTHNKVRRAEQSGAFEKVRVIDLGRTTAAHREQGEETGRSVVTHVRRQHWRSVRVATRNEHGEIVGSVQGERGVDWHYEARFVAATIVNPAGRPGGGTRIYRVGA